MSRLVCFAGVVTSCAVSLAGCPIEGGRAAIGAPCDVEDACPLDHFCLANDPADPADGRCAPVLDYGGCPAPTYPQKQTKALDDTLEITDPATMIRLEDVVAIDGDLRFFEEGLSGVLAVGDLCGASGLQRVAGAMSITETDVTSLDGLQSLAVVGGGLLVHGNAELVDVLALKNLQHVEPRVGEDFGVLFANNRNLRRDAIEALKDALAESGSTVKVFSCGNRDDAVVDCAGFIDPVELR